MSFALLRIAAYALLVCSVVFAIAGTGWKLADTRWQSKWDSHLLADTEATAQADAYQRQIEQAHQKAMDLVTTDAQQQINHANADAADAAAAAVSLRDTIDQTVSRLADSQARISACTTASSQAAARAARVLADVLKRADQRAGVLATTADQARARGLACEAAYDAVDSK
jgi:hypothetical protein